MDVTDNMFKKEPAFISLDAIKSILGEDLRRVMPKLSKQLEPTTIIELGFVARAIRKKVPHRMAALDAWKAKQKARVDAHNAHINRLIEARAQIYIDEMGRDRSQALWDAKFVVYRELAPAFDW